MLYALAYIFWFLAIGSFFVYVFDVIILKLFPIKMNYLGGTFQEEIKEIESSIQDRKEQGIRALNLSLLMTIGCLLYKFLIGKVSVGFLNNFANTDPTSYYLGIKSINVCAGIVFVTLIPTLIGHMSFRLFIKNEIRTIERAKQEYGRWKKNLID
ncbi:hypothetical protein P8822_00280 [Bacillus sonorensis]|uniref:hypothetical protein n=1 Tax=Bacillus subtilis group TaxID=653685 RepID=UPI001FD6B086|nr:MULTISPECIES: hypothetical protein [Bacillus subtilis group]MCJ8223685.1 hypothetical protein [Bacillus paralicheniformis]MEC0526250.1 hypothetical protein [Bacillus sonorensis]